MCAVIITLSSCTHVNDKTSFYVKLEINQIIILQSFKIQIRVLWDVMLCHCIVLPNICNVEVTFKHYEPLTQ